MLSWLPENVSTYGGDVDFIFNVIYWITTISCVGVLAAMVWFVIRYRARPGGRAVYTHGNVTLEIIWTIVPTAVFVMIGVMSGSVWSAMKQEIPDTSLVVRVQGSQFNWQMTYPGLDGRFGTPDDYSQENLMRAPVGRPVKLILTAKDVIHSFFVPQMRLKQDALPGREILAWFEATKEGSYEIPCAELCGFGHSQMKGELRVLSQADFDAWVLEKKAFPQEMQGQ